MSRLLFSVVLVWMNFLMLQAKTITVSNDPLSPAQYSNLQTAINAAVAGDVLLVTGTGTEYRNENESTITLSKKLLLYGQGYWPAKEQSTSSSKMYGLEITAGGSGSTIAGFEITTLQSPEANNLVITGNKLQGVTLGGAGLLIRKNIIYSIGLTDASNSTVQNNLITGTISSNPTSSNNLVSNNLFTSTYTIVYGSNMTFQNNIFAYRSAEGSNFIVYSSQVNLTFRNNLVYNNTETNPFLSGTNNIIATGTILNKNPLFTNFRLDVPNGNILSGDDLRLKAGSPARGAGLGGVDIGPYGGSDPIEYPLSGQPAIPQISSFTIGNNIIPSNGALRITVKAKSH